MSPPWRCAFVPPFGLPQVPLLSDPFVQIFYLSTFSGLTSSHVLAMPMGRLSSLPRALREARQQCGEGCLLRVNAELPLRS